MNILEQYKTQLGIAGSLILLAMGAIYLLRGAYIFPLGWVVASVITNVWLLMGIIWYYNDNTRFNPEGSIFKGARKHGLPILRLWALNGFHKHVLGQKTKKGDIVFDYDKNHREGIHIDPRIQSGNVPKHHTIGGLEIFDYALKSPTAGSIKETLANDTIIKHVRKNHPILSVLPDRIIIEYVGRARNELPHDCKNLAAETDFSSLTYHKSDIAQYKKDIEEDIRSELDESGAIPTTLDGTTIDFKKYDAIVKQMTNDRWEAESSKYLTDYRASALVDEFTKIQEELAVIPIEADRFFSFAEAFQNSLSAVLSLDLQTILHLFEVAAEKKHAMDLKWIAIIGFAGMLILVGAGLAYKFASG